MRIVSLGLQVLPPTLLSLVFFVAGRVASKVPKLGWWGHFKQGLWDLGRELKVLHNQPVFLANAWGFVPVQACLGVFTFWGPKVIMLTSSRQANSLQSTEYDVALVHLQA